MTVLDEWTRALEDGDNLDALYMDIAKAFDSVPHQRLLVKLKGYGICGTVQQSTMHSSLAVDMPSVVAYPVHLFADDTKLYRRVTTLEDHKTMPDDLTNLEDWSTKWNLCFNSYKCKVMHIGHSNPQQEYAM